MKGTAWEVLQEDPIRRLAPPAELKARLRAQLATAPPPTRAAVARQAALLALGAWAVTLIVFLVAGGARPLGRPVSLTAGTALGIAIIAVTVAGVTFRRGRSTLGRARWKLAAVLISSQLLILTWKIFWSAQYPGAFEESPTRPGIRCFALSLMLGLPPLVAFATGRRSSDPLRPLLTGFSSGIAIGCLTLVLTDLWCPVGYLPHVLLGHLLPILLLGALGAWLGARLINANTSLRVAKARNCV